MRPGMIFLHKPLLADVADERFGRPSDVPDQAPLSHFTEYLTLAGGLQKLTFNAQLNNSFD